MGVIRFILMMRCPSIVLKLASLYWEMALSFFHRKDAEGAEDYDFMFAVERPRLMDGIQATANIKVNPPNTEKILSALLSKFTLIGYSEYKIFGRYPWEPPSL